MRVRTNLQRLGLVGIVSAPLLLGGCAWLTRASVSSSGGDTIRGSERPALSADARYVAFLSQSDELVPGDETAGLHGQDVFRRDLRAGTTERVSVDVDGNDPNAYSDSPSITGDGRYIAFHSLASDLIPNDTNNAQDVFVRDMQTGATTLVSEDPTGAVGDGNSLWPSISRDGRYIAFSSQASTLVPGDDIDTRDIFVRDRVNGTTARVPESTEGDLPKVSADGRVVVFHEGGSFAEGISVYDFATGVTTDVPWLDEQIYARDPAISGNGRYVGMNVLERIGSGQVGQAVYRYDRATGAIVMASVNVAGGRPDSHSYVDSLSDDGRAVVFTSDATDIVADGGGGEAGVFVRDMQASTSTRVTATALGHPSTGSNGSISPDGRYVAFDSSAFDYAHGERNSDDRDVFVRAVLLPTVEQVTPTSIARGQTVTFTIVGANFTPDAYVRAVTATTGAHDVTVVSSTFVSATEMTATIAVDADAPTEPLGIVVAVPGPGPGVVSGSAGACTVCPSIT